MPDIFITAGMVARGKPDPETDVLAAILEVELAARVVLKVR
jgi:beta-phosphoglucomutase-like phosphatase (HAD superfamily)